MQLCRAHVVHTHKVAGCRYDCTQPNDINCYQLQPVSPACYIHLAVSLLYTPCCQLVIYTLLSACYIHLAVSLLYTPCCQLVIYTLLSACYIHLAVSLIYTPCCKLVIYTLLSACYIHLAVSLLYRISRNFNGTNIWRFL